jgi:hypothetical protein
MFTVELCLQDGFELASLTYLRRTINDREADWTIINYLTDVE